MARVIRRALSTVDAMSPLVRLSLLLAALALATHAATAQGPQNPAPPADKPQAPAVQPPKSAAPPSPASAAPAPGPAPARPAPPISAAANPAAAAYVAQVTRR